MRKINCFFSFEVVESKSMINDIIDTVKETFDKYLKDSEFELFYYHKKGKQYTDYLDKEGIAGLKSANDFCYGIRKSTSVYNKAYILAAHCNLNK